MARKMKTMDGNTAAAHVSYAFTEVAAIYPITPSSTMAEYVDKWSAEGLKNVFGQTVNVVEMQSEGGAAGAVHGSLTAGALTTTYTASQGLLLMIPNMYKIAGEQLPSVIHCSARTISSHALSIFGDHQDVMACRQTGYAMLASNSPQEAMDLGAVAHLAAIKGSMPFLHFFDGFRTSHEMQKVAVWDYDELKEMLDTDAVAAFRAGANNPNHPHLKGSAQNGDIFFQVREASNGRYLALPDVVESYMNEVNRRIGTDYKLFNYYGAPDAEYVLVGMGSVCETAEEVVDYLCAKGEKVGLVKVHLYRPFSVKHLLSVLPETVKAVAVLDRTKEPGSLGEPLYLDIASALTGSEKFSAVRVYGGRYGLSSKDTPPAAVLSAFRNIQSEKPVNGFTVGIVDDVTHLSVPMTEFPDTTPKDIISCKFWGLGSDGTVGANKNSIKIIGDHTDKKVQAYFQYDSRKSGGVTISHLRFGDSPIKSAYYISQADFVACHNPSYIPKFKMAQDVRPGGAFLLNCACETAQELESVLPGEARAYIAKNGVRVYTIDAIRIAREIGLGNKTNAILQAAFFKLANILPLDDAVTYMKEAVRTTYGRKGENIVNMNIAAIDAGLAPIEIQVPAAWADAAGGYDTTKHDTGRDELTRYANDILEPVNAMRGDELPVSAFLETQNGTLPSGTAACEKRGIAVDVPCWIPENCIQCNQCAYVCPHAVVRPFVMTGEEVSAAPEGVKTAQMTGKGCENYRFMIGVSVLDCTGCGSCANVCPAKEKAIVMKPIEGEMQQQTVFNYAFDKVSPKAVPFAESTVKGSQFKQPLLEFPGACAGCGETPYAKLATQLFGERMYIANATGCSSIWGGSAPSVPYTVSKSGKGPAWANSLFEDNAEFGLGILHGVKQRRKALAEKAARLTEIPYADEELVELCRAWLNAMDDAAESRKAGDALEKKCRELDARDFTGTPFEQKWLDNGRKCPCEACSIVRDILANADVLAKPSFWVFGGDGWAYDIGYGGLDHVLASGENINVLVFDTEVYSNTGGQASKSTNIGAVAQFAAAGKSVKKKDLAQIAMSYGYVYVAQCAMGANYQQVLKAMTEAEAYDGPSLIICYAPCINHGSKLGMGKSISIEKNAVDAGYWNIFRFDPRAAAEGKNPLTLDCKAPSASYRDFLMSEVRFSSLKLSFPERAETLYEKAEENAKAKFAHLEQQAK